MLADIKKKEQPRVNLKAVPPADKSSVTVKLGSTLDHFVENINIQSSFSAILDALLEAAGRYKAATEA